MGDGTDLSQQSGADGDDEDQDGVGPHPLLSSLKEETVKSSDQSPLQ